MTDRRADKTVPQPGPQPTQLVPVVRLVARPSVTIVDGRLVAVRELAERQPAT